MIYSELKPAWHLKRIQQLRATGRCSPAQIQLIISDLCNQDCSFCAYRMEGYTSNQHFGDDTGRNPKRFIPKAKAKQIIRDADEAGVRAVQFTGGGEPTVHPDHMDIFSYAQSRGMQCALVTNGMLLRDGWEKVLPGFAWIRVSLDAGTKEMYASTRRTKPENFQKVLDNLSALCKVKGDCTVGVSFVATLDNWHEMNRACALASNAGADNFRITAMFSPDLAAYYAGIGREIAKRAKSLAEQQPGFAIDMFSGRLEDLSNGSPDYPQCYYQHMNVYIGGDLKVYRCCNTAYNDIGEVGSLATSSFKDFLAKKNKAYADFDPKSCRHCAFNRQNKVMNYMVSKPPHVEFV